MDIAEIRLAALRLAQERSNSITEVLAAARHYSDFILQADDAEILELARKLKVCYAVNPSLRP